MLCYVMIVSSVSVYLVFLLLPGALNSLVTRFKTHFVSRVTLLVIGSSLLFLLDCLINSSSRSMSVVFMDGLSSLSSNLLIYEVLLMLVALMVLVLFLGLLLALVAITLDSVICYYLCSLLSTPNYP